MQILKKDLPAPTLPEQRIVSVPELGGEVVIRPLLLRDRLALVNAPRLGEGGAPGFAHIASLLTYAVVDANGEQLYTTEQWEAFGGKNLAKALELWDQAWEISGLAEGLPVPKKEPEAPSSSSP